MSEKKHAEPMAIEALRIRIRSAVNAREAVELERMLDEALRAATQVSNR